MVTLLTVFAAVWIVGVLALCTGLFRAPEGSQDDAGFRVFRR